MPRRLITIFTRVVGDDLMDDVNSLRAFNIEERPDGRWSVGPASNDPVVVGETVDTFAEAVEAAREGLIDMHPTFFRQSRNLGRDLRIRRKPPE